MRTIPIYICCQLNQTTPVTLQPLNSFCNVSQHACRPVAAINAFALQTYLIRISSMGNYGARLFSLTMAAILGGYVLATAAAIFLGAVLPFPPAESVMAGTLFSFSVYTGGVIWVFAVRDVRHAWVGLLLPAAGLALARMLSAKV